MIYYLIYMRKFLINFLFFSSLIYLCYCDILMIRHERSRVRHSSQKNHIRWGLRAFNNLTLDYDFESFEQVNDTQLDVGNSSLGGNLTSEIEFNKLDLDYGTNLIKTNRKLERVATAVDQPTLQLNPNNGTFVIRKKLGKKAIMANIRKNVNKGLEYLKMHANLTEMTMMNDQPLQQLETPIIEQNQPPLMPQQTSSLNRNNNSKNKNHNNFSTKSTTFLDNFPSDLNNMNNNLNQSDFNNNKLEIPSSATTPTTITNIDDSTTLYSNTIATTTTTASSIPFTTIATTRKMVGTPTSVHIINNDKSNHNNFLNGQNKNNKEIHYRHQQQHHTAIKNIIVPKTNGNGGGGVGADGEVDGRRHHHRVEDFVAKIDGKVADDKMKLLISQIENKNSYQSDDAVKQRMNTKKYHNEHDDSDDDNNENDDDDDDDDGVVDHNDGESSSKQKPISKKKLVETKKLPSHVNRHHIIDDNDEIQNNGSDGFSGGDVGDDGHGFGFAGVDQNTKFINDNPNNDNENFIKFYQQQNFTKFDESTSLDYTNDNFDIVNDDSGNEVEELIRENINDNDEQIQNIHGLKIEDIDLKDLDETSRNNRINLMRGKDVVTKFLQIVETQHLLGANCTAGTALNLGEGVVDRYAQDRFRIEAEVAVNRANMLTRIFKTTSLAVQASEHLLHASVLSMVEFDDDIFAAGNCFDWNQHPAKRNHSEKLYCPFAYRLPPPNQEVALAKDLSEEYHYLGNSSEWFYLARKNAEKVIAKNEQYIKAYHLYTNSTSREADEILSVKYEDGRWSKPYYDCGGGNIWMLTYTVPFFGYENGTYFFKGTSGIDIDLRRVDIDQCPQKISGTPQPLNIFAGTDKCKQRTTECNAIPGLGFRRGSYRCVCRRGFYFPDINSHLKFFNGSTLEEEYEKFMLGEITIYNDLHAYQCLPCAEGCDQCMDSSPCVAALNWPMRTSILVLACTIIGSLPPAVLFTFKYQRVKVVRAASPALLRVIALGAFFIYCTSIVMYPPPSIYTCTAKVWLREIGFSLTYGALMLKTWRISVIFRVRSAKAVKITDASLLKRLGILCCVVGAALLVRTIVAPPLVVVGRTKDDLKAFLCKTDWWDHTFTSMEVLFLAWGVRLCIMVRKAPSEFNESRFISMAIYNEFLLTCFLNVSMLFLQSPANPDLLYIIFFCHTQLTVTLLLALIFGSKVYLVFRGGGKPPEESMVLGIKSSGAKFICRSQARTLANPSTATSSTAQLDMRLTEQEALEEIRILCNQLHHLHERAPPRGVAVVTIAALLEMCKTTQSTLKPPILAQITAGVNIERTDKGINTETLDDYCPHSNKNGHVGDGTRITITGDFDNDNRCVKNSDRCLSGCAINSKLKTNTSTVVNPCSNIYKKSDGNDVNNGGGCDVEGGCVGDKSICDLDFDNLELECMCSSTDECENDEKDFELKFNRKFKISCRKGIHNFEISNKNLQNILLDDNCIKLSSNSLELVNKLNDSNHQNIHQPHHLHHHLPHHQIQPHRTSSSKNNTLCDKISSTTTPPSVSSSASSSSSAASTTTATCSSVVVSPGTKGLSNKSTKKTILVNDLDSLSDKQFENNSNPSNTISLTKQLHLNLVHKNLPAGQSGPQSQQRKPHQKSSQHHHQQHSPKMSPTRHDVDDDKSPTTIVVTPTNHGAKIVISTSGDGDGDDDSVGNATATGAAGTATGNNGNGNASNSTGNNNKRNNKQLVLDLNDRSKYTKEVSV